MMAMGDMIEDGAASWMMGGQLGMGMPGQVGMGGGGLGCGAAIVPPPGAGPCGQVGMGAMPPLGGMGADHLMAANVAGQFGNLLPGGLGALAGCVGMGGQADGPSASAQMAAMMVYQNPELASQLTRHAAEMYESNVSIDIDPDVTELAHNFNLDQRSTMALDREMKKRKNSFEEDMEALWDILGGARNPSGLLMVKVREMQEGVFRGFSTPEKNVQEFARRFKLDAQASAKLAEVLSKRESADEDMRKLAKHLERSNKPSALMMIMLKDLRMGKPVKEPEHQAAMGSSVHMKEIRDQKRREEDKRRRSRSAQRYRSRSRDRRSRDRKDRRSRSRSRAKRR